MLIFISLILLLGCTKEDEKEIISYQTITSEDAHNMMETRTDLIIIDVRSKEEYEISHIENAINMPVNELGNRFKEEITDNLEQTILVYCRSGVRAKQASELLSDLGYKNVFNFGGLLDWNYDLVTN